MTQYKLTPTSTAWASFTNNLKPHRKSVRVRPLKHGDLCFQPAGTSALRTSITSFILMSVPSGSGLMQKSQGLNVNPLFSKLILLRRVRLPLPSCVMLDHSHCLLLLCPCWLGEASPLTNHQVPAHEPSLKYFRAVQPMSGGGEDSVPRVQDHD